MFRGIRRRFDGTTTFRRWPPVVSAYSATVEKRFTGTLGVAGSLQVDVCCAKEANRKTSET